MYFNKNYDVILYDDINLPFLEFLKLLLEYIVRMLILIYKQCQLNIFL